MKYILIENLQAYEYAKKLYKKEFKKIVWITTSPFIINFFSKKKINFIKIENYISQNELNDLHKICIKFIEKLTSFLNEVSSWRDYIDFKYVLGSLCLNYISAIFYKCLIIIKIKENFNGEIIIVGDSNEKNCIDERVKSFFFRFANLYAFLANKYFPDIKVINLKQNQKLIIEKKLEVERSSMNFNEKILSILNNNVSSIFFKLFLKLFDYGLIKKISLFYKKKKNQIVIYSGTDTIECAFIRLLNEGHEITFVKLPNINFTEPLKSECEIFYSKYKNFFLKNFKNQFNKYKEVKYNPIFESVLNDIMINIVTRKFRLKKNLPQINESFKKKIKEFDKNHLFFSNYSHEEIPLLYMLYLKKNKNIKVVLFEHGVVDGILKTYKYLKKINLMNIADIGVYLWKKSLFFKKNSSKQKVLISGFSFKHINNSLETLKKFLIKKIIKIKNKKKSIILVADIEKNNLIYGPYLGNDFNYYQDTRTIIEYLCKNNSDKNVFLKLYPTNRYLENYNFTDLKIKYSNLYIIRFIDFRFIREYFDEIYTSIYQSTLGWVLPCQNKNYVLERSVSPANLEEIKKKKIYIKIKGIKNFILLNRNFPKDNFDWIKKLI